MRSKALFPDNLRHPGGVAFFHLSTATISIWSSLMNLKRTLLSLKAVSIRNLLREGMQ
jgi:hypothetical protein